MSHDGSISLTGLAPGDDRGAPRRGNPEGHGQVLTTKVALHIPGALSYDDWEIAGQRLSGILDSSCWWLGDWLIYGKHHYADMYQRGISAAGLRYQTLRNYAWIARRFPHSRRRSALTFQHHAEIAALPGDEQDQWLDRAEERGWTTKQLRTAIRLARDNPVTVSSAAVAEGAKRLTLPGNRVEWWYKAAEQSGTVFEQWVLTTLDHAAEKALCVEE